MEGNARSLLLPKPFRRGCARASPRAATLRSGPVPRARPQAPRGHLRSRTVEGAAQCRERRNRRRLRARGRRHHRRTQEQVRAIKARDRRARRAGEGRSTKSFASCWPAFPTCRTNRFRWARTPTDNVEVRRDGRAAAIRFRAQGALGPGPGAGHPGPRARRQNHRRALRPLLGPGRQAGARAHQFHARRAHPRARLHRGAAALPGELREPVRHRPVAQVQGRPVQVRGHGFLADSHGRSAGHQHLRATKRWRPTRCRSSCAPTRRVSAARPAPTAATCAASSASTSSRRWSW